MLKLTTQFIDSIHHIAPELWQSLFDPNYPFTRHAFLAALEDSGCTTAAKGWQVHHLTIYHAEQLVAVLPCYIKTHSYGEYIFDWSWADAYHQQGLEYYPKIVCAIPYTPASGARLGIVNGFESQSTAIIICVNQALAELAQTIKASNWQCLFPEKAFSDQLSANHWLQRIDVQFHWFNRNYSSFNDFISAFNARKRKNVLKERNQVRSHHIEIEQLEGQAITESLWQHFFTFYQATYLKRSRHGGYLNLAFFLALGRTMTAQLMMVVARKDQQVIAAALYFKSPNTLFGRYWGCSEPLPFLHFECCYYQGIDYCIENNIARFDAGAQGEHKIPRGFEPIITYANYHILHPQFGPAIANYLEQERSHIHQYIAEVQTRSPFKSSQPL